ncbi:MAG: ATP-binding cassette domain-containing protein [Ligilactobacillus agilis]|uniref:ABC transporter ATP-binding protein/permease n=1 Tax=Ligilactobacillus agilis TaxID=1601 RepID=UPI00242CF08F|nr:ABC transporter ATP-binding protein/permease [Ligilactobacillus agilis]MCI5762555.1 ATP-binding cassette domain-containing protein [Ligilactobacillus agilis]
MAVLELKNVTKTYKLAGGGSFQALKGISASFEAGELVAIVGESGSGKSTLMNTIGGLDSDFGGQIIYEGKNLATYSKQELVDYHKKSIGFIFQNFNLIPHLSLLDNVAMAMTLSNVDQKTREARAKELLKQVGLEAHIYKKPDAISGGQKQRVAIARALINDPDMIIADEPTGALDAETTTIVLEMIKDIAKSGKLVLMVTHSERVASHCSRVLRIDNGQLLEDFRQEELVIEDSQNKEQVAVKNMSWYNAFRLALLNMKAKFGRNALVAVGSSIGIMSVVLMLSLGKGVTSYVKSTMNSYTNPKVTEVHKNGTSNQKRMATQTNGNSAAQAQANQDMLKALTGTGNDSGFSQKEIKKLASLKDVTKAQKGFSTISLGTTTVKYKNKEASIVQLQTMSSAVTDSNIRQGKRPGKNEILIDAGTADILGKNMIGKKVTLHLTVDSKQIEKTFRVAGTYSLSASGSSTATILARYSDLASLYKETGTNLKPNVIYLTAKDKDATSRVKDKVKDLGYSGSMQEAMTDMFSNMLTIITDVLTGIAAISLIVSAIMILVVLNISVVERTKEIGVLKALGARRKDIRRIFVSEAFLIGLSAGALGDLVTWILSLIANHFSQAMFEINVVAITPQYVISGLVISILISMLAGMMPANRASKLDPVDSLRKE